MVSADLVIEAGLSSYDISAPACVIEAAGGVVTTWDGKPPFNGGRIVAASNERLHKSALDELNSYWSDRNGFSSDPKTESFTASGLTVEMKQFGETIHHYKVIGGDHVWLDISNNGFSTNQLIWNFFTKFDLNGLR